LELNKAKDETDLLVDQIRTVANQRFMGDKPLAELPRTHMKRVEEALRTLTGEKRCIACIHYISSYHFNSIFFYAAGCHFIPAPPPSDRKLEC